MIITTEEGQSFDTERDLTSAERHILQKLFLWESMASSLDQFKFKKVEAFEKGWNNSGPICETDSMRVVIRHLEKRVSARLRE